MIVFAQSKGDLKGAENYYSRAILASPRDGEIISQYANLLWELYHDHDKALCYYERAVEAAPEDRYKEANYSINSSVFTFSSFLRYDKLGPCFQPYSGSIC